MPLSKNRPDAEHALGYKKGVVYGKDAITIMRFAIVISFLALILVSFVSAEDPSVEGAKSLEETLGGKIFVADDNTLQVQKPWSVFPVKVQKGLAAQQAAPSMDKASTVVSAAMESATANKFVMLLLVRTS